jgi:hypothetical protein
MIKETILENGLIERKSDRGVYIRNEQLGHEYSSAVDLPNEKRKKLGLEEYSYVETERVIEEVLEPTNEIDPEIYQKAKAFDILIGGAV